MRAMRSRRSCVLVALLALAGCTEPERIEVKIVDVYRTGFALRKIITVVEMPDGSRQQIGGKLGKVGDTVFVWLHGDTLGVDDGKSAKEGG